MTKETIHNIRRMCPLGTDLDAWIAFELSDMEDAKCRMRRINDEEVAATNKFNDTLRSIEARREQVQDSCKHYDVTNVDAYTACKTCGKIME